MRCVGDAPTYGAAARTEWDIRREELVNEHVVALIGVTYVGGGNCLLSQVSYCIAGRWAHSNSFALDVLACENARLKTLWGRGAEDAI
jgi:hypothetical protein